MAALAASDSMLRIPVQVPPDVCSGGQVLTFWIVMPPDSTIDDLKQQVCDELQKCTGIPPRRNAFQLHQFGRHLPYTSQISIVSTSSDIAEPVRFVRTWAHY